eukprot:m.43826 g.43826  ORF g.43826 m.43826 type:complete len:370 (-) comp10012_c0_seq3:109-1218(-)
MAELNMKQVVASVRKGNVDKVKKWLCSEGDEDKRAKLVNNSVNKNGDTLLIMATRYGRHELVSMLITAGANVNAANLVGHTPLHEASLFGEETNGASGSKCIEVLCRANANVHSLKHAHWTPLHLACTKSRNEKAIAALLKHGTDINLKNKDGWNAFHLICKTENSGAATQLILQQDPGQATVPSKNGRTPLMTAALHGNMESARLIVETDKNTVHTEDSCGQTALYSAVLGGHATIAEYLINVGSNIVHRDKREQTPLHTVCIAGDGGEYFTTTSAESIATCKHILQTLFNRYGESYEDHINSVDIQGCLPIHYACLQGNLDMAMLLLEHKADVNRADKLGRSPLSLAQQFGKEELHKAINKKFPKTL